MIEEILEAWQIHNAVNIYLLEHISDAGFGAVTLLKNGQPSTGRNVAKVFKHMLEVRIAKIPKAFLNDVPPPEAEPTRQG